MTKMMIDMGIRPSGDVDKDFVAMMTPHHQGAIDMAMAELRYGHNERLRRMAQEIIITQQQEIAAMRLAVNQPIPPSVPSPEQPSSAQLCAEIYPIPSDGPRQRNRDMKRTFDFDRNVGCNSSPCRAVRPGGPSARRGVRSGRADQPS